MDLSEVNEKASMKKVYQQREIGTFSEAYCSANNVLDLMRAGSSGNSEKFKKARKKR